MRMMKRQQTRCGLQDKTVSLDRGGAGVLDVLDRPSAASITAFSMFPVKRLRYFTF